MTPPLQTKARAVRRSFDPSIEAIVVVEDDGFDKTLASLKGITVGIHLVDLVGLGEWRDASMNVTVVRPHPADDPMLRLDRTFGSMTVSARWLLLLEAGEVITRRLGERLVEIASRQSPEGAYAYGARRIVEFMGSRVHDPRCTDAVARFAPISAIIGFRKPSSGGLVVDVPTRATGEAIEDRRDAPIEAILRRWHQETSARAMESRGSGRSGMLASLCRFGARMLLSPVGPGGSAGRRLRSLAAAYDPVTVLKRVDAARPSERREAASPPESSKSRSLRLPVTVIVPVLNEERNLMECLSRLGRFERILVIDSGSRDRSVEVARRHGAEPIEFRWNGRFPKKRNWVLRNIPIHSEWVLFLDADEFVTDAFADELERTLPRSPHAGFWLAYRSHFMGKFLRRGDRFSKLALIRRGAGEYERIDEERWSRLDMEVHEHPLLAGTTGRIAAPIDHRDYKGLDAYLARHNDYSSWEAKRFAELRRRGSVDGLTGRQRAKYRHLSRAWFASSYFLASYLLKGGFVDGLAGFGFAYLKWLYFKEIRLKIIEESGSRRASGG